MADDTTTSTFPWKAVLITGAILGGGLLLLNAGGALGAVAVARASGASAPPPLPPSRFNPGWYAFVSWGGRKFWKEANRFDTKTEADAYAAKERSADSGLEHPVKTRVARIESDEAFNRIFEAPVGGTRRARRRR